ncbi:MAG TPA: succinate dehydrogenase, cytochrome b556 subunit [Ignavibacteria bacterium]
MAEIRKFDQKNWVKTNLKYRKDSGSWAWIIHRISGIALIGYLFLHIYSLSPLSQGREAFNHKMQLYSGAFWMVTEWLLFAFVLFHSLNGVRIVLVDWADGANYHKALYRYSVVIGILMFFAMGYVMFSHEINNFLR